MRKDMTAALKWIATIIIAFGVICSAWNIREFNDSNLGLMVGIGFLVGGLQILLFGVAAPLMMKKSERAAESDPVEDLA